MHSVSAAGQVKLFLVTGVVACTLLASKARGSDCYFMVIFSAQHQDGRNPPAQSHSFGTFVKATGDGKQPEQFQLDSFTLSWLPATGEVHPWRLPELGRNI